MKEIRTVFGCWVSGRPKRSVIGEKIFTRDLHDKKGNIASIEYSHKYTKLITGDSIRGLNKPDGFLWHTNHHIWLEPDKIKSPLKHNYDFDINSSFKRAERAYKLANKHYGKIDIPTLKNISKDHGNISNLNNESCRDAICRHHKLDGWHTFFAFMVKPNEFKAYWTKGNPCKNEFIEYYCKDILTN